MELTKFEARVMDPRYLQKCRWYYLYTGLVFIAIGLFVVVYGYMKPIPKTAAIWESNVASLKKIVPTTNEKELFDIASSSMDAARLGWTGYVEEKTRSTSVIFLFIGSFLFGTYFREKRYKQLIEKIKSS